MKLPLPRYTPTVQKFQQREFGGVIARAGAQEGQIIEAYNMSTDEYPLLAVRKEGYQRREDLEEGHEDAILSDGDTLWIVGGELGIPFIWHYDKNMNLISYEEMAFTVSSGKPQMLRFQDRIIVYPGMVSVSISQEGTPPHEVLSVETIDAKIRRKKTDVSSTVEIDTDPVLGKNTMTIIGKIAEYSDARGRSSYNSGYADAYGAFRAGDTVELSGFVDSYVDNNRSVRVLSYAYDSETDTHSFTFDCDDMVTGTLDDSEDYPIYVVRNCPDFDILFVCDNRLWGAKGKTIYCSALGNAYGWEIYEGLDTDSWTVEVAIPKDFLGGIAYQGYPTFFHESGIVKVYGAYPSAYQTVETANIEGLREGAGKTLAQVGAYLYYVSEFGIMRYSGSTPQRISEPVFDLFKGEHPLSVLGSAAGLDNKYFLPVLSYGFDGYQPRILIYDTGRGTFEQDEMFEEDTDGKPIPPLAGGATADFLDLAVAGDMIFTLCHYTASVFPSTERTEANFLTRRKVPPYRVKTYSYVRFDNLFDGSEDRKHAISLQVRYYAEPVTVGTSDVSYLRFYVGDGDRWETYEAAVVGSNTGDYGIVIPLRPHRYDRLILRIEANCYYRIYDITRCRTFGSEKK